MTANTAFGVSTPVNSRSINNAFDAVLNGGYDFSNIVATGSVTAATLTVTGLSSLGEVLATTKLSAGRGVGIKADPTNTQSILQFTNNAVSSQWSSIVATNNLLNVTTPFSVTGTITATSNIGWSASTYLTPVTGGTTNYGSVKVTGTPTSSGWSGYSINGDAVFMSEVNNYGLYDNTNLEWGILCARNGSTQIYHNGTSRLGTQANGVNVTSPAPTISIGGWSSGSAYSAIEASGYGYILLGQAADVNTYVRSVAGVVRIGTPSNNTLTVGATDITITGSMALSASTNAYVSYANTADTALPWSQGPTFQGQTGWAFYSSQAGGYRMGFRGNSAGTYRYLWCVDKSLFGSQPNDSIMNDTINISSGSAWFSAMPASTGSTVVNTFGFLRYVSSRRELKDNIVDVELSDGLDRILALRPVEFTMKPEYLADANEYTPFDVKRGFIAQETAEVDHRYGQWGWVDENQMMATTPAINGELPLEEATPIYWNHDAVIADLVASIQNINTRLVELEKI
ncbi:Intramolecular chaperone auto-processing domain containing protein [uncultured Caudovirales phage]|uniref:Intramolecular chaperone auto-processing domain containing protein n=1 Tax=uncultured Caudovirales phage TaxID=2100421 RepID=A0A6J5NA03_9CAUD|nr:Intramolecular chaperone auto-processing domain containing protein [uncultured Caudovirales phage]